MKFTDLEKTHLEHYGFEYTLAGYQRQYSNNDIVTIVKEDDDDFTYYLDVAGSDIYKANNNQTIDDLTWEELVDKIDYA